MPQGLDGPLGQIELPSELGDGQTALVEALERSDAYNTTTGITKRTLTGADAAIRVNANRNRQQPGVFPLNPFTPRVYPGLSLGACYFEFVRLDPRLRGDDAGVRAGMTLE